ncbi:MAG: helix-turn-helix domain-containing protein [Bdellovibrionales bacterium]
MSKDIHITSIPYNEQIGAFFKKQRKACGLKQIDLATKLGFKSPQFVSNVERGLCAYSPGHLAIVTELCKINEDELVAILLKNYENYLRKKLAGTDPEN